MDESYTNSEYSKKGTFYISPTKWKRLSGRICRVKATVAIYEIARGFASRVKLDTTHNDNIGMTRESLDKYVRDVLIPRQKGRRYWYHIEKWNITTA